MVPRNTVLICLLLLVEQIPVPPVQAPAGRGRPTIYSRRLFLKAVVIMVVQRLPTIHALLAVLDQPEMAPVRALLCADGRYPRRRTWERRLKALPASLPA